MVSSMEKIRVSKSVVGDREVQAVAEVLRAGYLGMGSEVERFEREITDFLGGGVEVSCVNTGTAAMQIALQSCGVGPGDEVLVPSLTYVATFQAISATGATPVACDVSIDNGCLLLPSAEEKKTGRTKAILPVHYASNPGANELIRSWAKKNGIRVIEDAAHSFGSRLQGQLIGSAAYGGDFVCFSFDGIKNITCGEGGAIVTRDSTAAQRIRDIRLLGVLKDTEKRFSGQRSWEFDVVEQGWRYHMSNIMAAIGRVQLTRLDAEFAPRRIQLYHHYRTCLKSLNADQEGCIRLFDEIPTGCVPHIFPIRVMNGRRDDVRSFLLEQGIETGIHYKPSHLLSFFGGGRVSLPNAERLYGEVLTLPLHPDLKEGDCDKIISALQTCISKNHDF